MAMMVEQTRTPPSSDAEATKVVHTSSSSGGGGGGSGGAAASTAQVLASLSAEKASELLKRALQSIPLSEKMSFNVDLKATMQSKENPAESSTIAQTAGDAAVVMDPRTRAPPVAAINQVSQDPRVRDPRLVKQHISQQISSSDPRLGRAPPSTMQMQMQMQPPRPRIEAPEREMEERERERPAGPTHSSHSGSSSSSNVKQAITELVKQFLRDPWKEKKLTRESFKTICKKTTDRVLMESFPKKSFPSQKDDIKRFMSVDKRKEIKRIVSGYVEKYKTR